MLGSQSAVLGLALPQHHEHRFSFSNPTFRLPKCTQRGLQVPAHTGCQPLGNQTPQGAPQTPLPRSTRSRLLAQKQLALNLPGSIAAGSLTALLSSPPSCLDRSWVLGCATTPFISYLFLGAVFCLRSILSTLHQRQAGREVHNFTDQNKFPAWGFAPKPVETRNVFPPPDWALARACGSSAGLWHAGWSSTGVMVRCNMPLLPTQLPEGGWGRMICLKMSLPPCPGSALQQEEFISTSSLHKTGTRSPSWA